MSNLTFLKTFVALCAVIALTSGCGKKDSHDDHGDDHGHSHGHSHGHGHEDGKDDHDDHAGHGHGEEGVAFKEGQGLILSDEIRNFLGLEMVLVTEEKLPLEISFTAQVYGETTANDPAARKFKASGLISTAQGEQVRGGQAVTFTNQAGNTITGTVIKAQLSPGLGETELTLEFPAVAELKTGDFVVVKLALTNETKALVIPRSAYLRAADGDFVYLVNGEAYLRTPVKIGAQTEQFIAITDGLKVGQSVVSQSVEMLWLTELRLTKGGGHSH